MYLFLSKIQIYLSLGFPSYRRSIQFSKKNIQHFNHTTESKNAEVDPLQEEIGTRKEKMSENASLREKVRGGLRTLYDKLGKRLCNGLIFGPLLLLCAKCGAPRGPCARPRAVAVSVLYCVTRVLYLLAGNSGGDVRWKRCLGSGFGSAWIHDDFALREIDQQGNINLTSSLSKWPFLPINRYRMFYDIFIT